MTYQPITYGLLKEKGVVLSHPAWGDYVKSMDQSLLVYNKSIATEFVRLYKLGLK